MTYAFRQIRRYPLQSALIVLTIALGVGVVTALYGAIQVQSKDRLWQREITLEDAQSVSRKDEVALREVRATTSPITFSETDLLRIKDEVPSLDYAYARARWQLPVSNRDRSYEAEVSYVTEDYLSAAEVKVQGGSSLSNSDFSERRQVILLTPELAERLEVSVGEEVTIGGARGEQEPFSVIGVLKPETGQGSAIPYGSMNSLDNDLRSLTLTVSDQDVLPSALEELETFARRTWGDRVAALGPSSSGVDQLISLIIFAFASTALLAASFNIMNLMLARVSRQTRDIGVRRALGATQGSIVKQFLAEALLLGLLGGLLGVLVGYGFAELYASAISTSGLGLGASSIFSWRSALLGVLISVAATLIFGLYPSVQASKLKVVDALGAL